MAELGSILLRRGTTAERLEFVPLKGEIIYDTELKQVFVGDGETYGGRSVFNDSIVVTNDGTIKVGENVAVVVDDTGIARSLRLPGGEADVRPEPVAGAIRYNTYDRTIEFSDGNEWFFVNKTSVNQDILELFVSLDGHDDRRYGAQRGRSWGTAFRTLNAAMREAEDIVNARPETEPFVNEEQPYRKVQVQVHVASGIYEEHLPIRVPTNTSIFGTGQRRTTVRPKAGVPSESPWAKIAFWRETEEYPEGLFGFHYLTDPADEFSTPKDNTDIDLFLCNDTNWFHTFGTDLHNSFCFVLDPEGQILTKSPYPHTGVSFAKSSYVTDPYAVGFHGGMFADGFTGNQDFNIDVVESDGAMIASGFWRKPNMPTAFYIDGVRYQADSVESDGLGEDDAAELLRLNKDFIAEETVQYVNDTYIFEYNEDRFRRDLNLILRNVGYDSVLGTNFLTFISATAYLRPNSAYLLGEQKPQTVGAINYTKGLANTSLTSHTPTQSANTQLFDTIINTISTENKPTVFWPQTVYDDEKNSVKDIIIANQNFIQQELIAWIGFQINNNIVPFVGYSYDQNKFRNETELLVNAVLFDLIYDGNYATQEVAKSYWQGITTQIPGQQTQYAAAFSFLSLLIRKILSNDENIDWLDKFQLDIPQELLQDIEPITTATLDKAQDLVTIVSEVVTNGTNYAPLVEFPDLQLLLNNRPPLFKQALEDAYDARAQLVEDTTTIINSTIAFVDTAYASFDYDEATCRRDVGLIIEAMRHDLIFGGDVETLKAAKSYFETGTTVIAEQEAQTVDAINYAKELAKNVVKNSVPDSVYQTELLQTQDSTYQAGVDIDTRLDELFGLITNLLSNFAGVKAAHDLIEANKEWIQDEVIAFIAAEFPALVYQTDICRRDTGLIVSAVSNDLFGSFVRSELAGRAYYRGASSIGNTEIVLNEQRDETIAANEYAKSLIAQILNNSTNNPDYPSSPYQTGTTQTTNSLTISNTLKQKANDAYSIILDIIGDGGESAGSNSLPKYKVNINDSTPLSSDLVDKNAVMITAGNKSFVATDWTMFGNLGYGVLARNNARCELVSIFTYYCGYTYKAESGSEIRSLNGSSSNGIYALGAEGRNPFEVPIRATTLSETVYVAEADSTVTGDNLLGDLQIVIRNAMDVNGNAAEFFNVMVAEVDHGSPVGLVRYEIGNFQGNTLNIRGSAQGLLANIPDGNDINIRLLQEYKVSTSSDISDLLLGAALIYDNEPETGYRILNIEQSGSDFEIRTIPTLSHFSVVANGTTSAGSNTININPINRTAEELIGRRIGYKGTIYIVTNYDGSNTLTLNKVLTADVLDLGSLRLSPAPGLQGNIFTDFSIVKAGNHDMLDVGTGAYEDSNYPRELFGPPTRPKIQSQEVDEIAPGRVFFTTNDQDGNFRVGDFFRVNQGDGSISFNAAIALSNLDGLGFSRGVTINEFSADSDMAGVSDEAVPTEQAVVNYINKRLGQDESGIGVGADRLGAGTLMLDGSQTMEGNLDMGGNDIENLDTLEVSLIDATTVDTDILIVNTSATLTNLTNNRIVLAGSSGILEDSPNLTYDGSNLSVSSDVNITGNTLLDGTLTTTGNVLPNTDNSQSLGSPTNRWRDIYLGAGTVFINNSGTLQEDANGNLQLISATDKNIVFSAPGTGIIEIEKSAEFGIDVSIANNLDVNGTAILASVQIENLTSGRITFVGADGSLIDNSALTFNTSTGTLGITGNISVSNTASFGSGQFGNLTSGRIPFVGALGLLQDEANLQYNTATNTLVLDGNLTVNNTTNLNSVQLGNLITGRIPFVGSAGLLQDEANLQYNTNTNTLVIDGNQEITGSLDFGSTNINDNIININGSEIYATGTSASGHIFIIPGFNESAIGNVTIQGNLNITGTVSTTDVGLGNTQVNGNFTALGNVDLGNATTDPITITGGINSNLVPLTDSLVDLGSTGINAKRWANIYTDNIETDDITVRRSGDISVFNSDGTPIEVFAVDGATGNTQLTGNLSINNESNFSVFDSSTPSPLAMFTVTGSTGDVFIRNNVDIDGNVDIAGDLTVVGNILADLNIEDNTVVLNVNYTGNPDVDGTNAGIEIERGTGTNVLIRWNETTDKWQLTNDGSNFDNIALIGDVNSAAGDTVISTLEFSTSTGVLTATLGDASTVTVDLDDRYVLIGGDSMTGTLEVDTITSASANTNLKLSGNGSGIVEVNDNLYLNSGTIIFEGSASASETTLTLTNPTADRTITLPDATGTVAVSVSDTTTSTQGDLNLDFTLSAAGNISATGDAHGLATTDSPTFAGLTINGASIVIEGATANTFETTLTVTDPTADRTITLPDATGTVAVSVSDSTTTTQGNLNLDLALSATGNISATGDAHGLAADDSPTFAGLTINGASIVFEGVTANNFETTFTVTDPTADRTITFQNATGTVAHTSDIGNGTITITAGTYLSNGEVDTNFSINQSGDQTITINHDVTTRSDTTSAETATTGGTVDVVSGVTTNATGHITAINVKTITLPSEADTLDTVADRGATTDQSITVGGLQTTSITTGAAATAGTITGNWSLTTGSRFEATYADVAEIYASDRDYEPGTVLMFGGAQEVTIANEYATTKLAGVVTTNPAFIMNNMAEGIAIALKGRIPVKVEGVVNKGDFIVASSTPGVGIACNKYIGGAIIGKAIENKVTQETALIEVKI